MKKIDTTLLDRLGKKLDRDGEPPDDDGMNIRVANLEKFAEESRIELRSIDVRLARLEVSIQSIERNVATKSDIADVRTVLNNIENKIGNAATEVQLEGLKTLLSQSETKTFRWFLGVVFAVASIGFAAARFFGP